MKSYDNDINLFQFRFYVVLLSQLSTQASPQIKVNKL